jgi:hypothetical protein
MLIAHVETITGPTRRWHGRTPISTRSCTEVEL